MPYLFDPEGGAHLKDFVPAQVLLEVAQDPSRALTHFEYFQLCVSCHYLTVATPVPTDVDIQIRKKLWPAQVPLETCLEMTDFVIDSRQWNYALVSNRTCSGAPGTPWQKEEISGHNGEWFTIAAGAYCALLQYSDPLARQKREALFDEIAKEIERHSEIFGSLWKALDGLNCLKAAAVIAHNFGDLDRVMDMWELSPADPLRLQFYKLTTLPFDSERKLRYLGRLWVAGQLYKAVLKTVPEEGSMAFENHRHFALRKPRCLRRSPELMIHTGPFLDAWGRQVAQSLTAADRKPTEDLMEVVQALLQGWERLPKTAGYGRALRGILEIIPDLSLGSLTKQQNKLLRIRQEEFEQKWNEEALKELDEIPSRAQ
jgi:hypothetical protein